MNQHFHEFPRFRDPPEPKRGPSIEGRRVTILVEEIPLGSLAVIIAANVTCKGIDDAYADDGATFDFACIDVTGLDGKVTRIGRPHLCDLSLQAHVWRAAVAHVEGSQGLCDRIMDKLEEAAS